MLNFESFFHNITYKRICFLGDEVNAVHKNPHFMKCLRSRLLKDIENGITFFSFGKNTQFCELCYNLVTELQQNFPYIVREKYICENDIDLKNYDNIYKIRLNNDTTILDLNKQIIDKSDICYIYHYDHVLPSQLCRFKEREIKKLEKSTIHLSYKYACNLNKEIFLIKK